MNPDVARRQDPWPERYEVRIGLVLFGGIALAVYMNGVMQELLRLVRAAQKQDDTCSYGRLLKAAKAGLMIDVIAGTSAGGLNGLVLAKALATGSDEIQEMSNLWRREAQIDKLVQTHDPHALLSGEVMEKNLLNVMRKMTATPNPELAAKVPVLDLFVTATDLVGRTVVYKDLFGKEIVQTRNQHTFHFKKRTVIDPNGPRYDLHGRKLSRGYDQNDFVGANPAQSLARDELLMKVGRATSAFPGALPPQHISRDDARRAGLEGILPDNIRDDYWLSDGGILMNKPFKPVVKTIFQRSATRPVERVLLFLDPDPPALKPQAAMAAAEPHILEVISAPMNLPRNEDIAAYLEEVQQQGQFRQNIVRGFAQVEQRLAEQGAPQTDGGALEGYRLMRASQALAEVAENFRMALGARSVEAEPVKTLMTLLKTQLGLAKEKTVPTREGMAELQQIWDHGYHTRRMHYLLLQLDVLLEQLARGKTQPEAVAGARQHLWNAMEDWRNAWWVTAYGREQHEDPQVRKWYEALAAEDLFVADTARQTLNAVYDYRKWIAARAADEENAAMSLLDAEGGEWKAIANRLRAISKGFESRDVLLFPLAQSGPLPEWDSVDVMEIAPGPTPHVKRSGKDRLASETLGHFGGFLEERWRQNDIMWGRLDAAEMIAQLIVKEAKDHLEPAELAELKQVAEECIATRHRAILYDEREIVQTEKLQQRYEFIQKHTVLADGPQAEEAEEAMRQVAAAVMTEYPPAPTGEALIRQAPMEVLWSYLTEDHNIGEETAADVAWSVKAAALLKGLDNLTVTLNRDTGSLSPVTNGMRTAALALLRPLRLGAKVVLPGAELMGWLSRRE